MIESIPPSDRNLVVTGYLGPNQLVVVRRVAERLGMPFVNYEARLEELADLPLSEIRIRYGESRVRAMEAQVIDELILYRGAVILVPGDTLMHGGNLERLSETSLIVCLVATLDAVLQRLHLSLGARYHNPAERAVALGSLKREWAVRQSPLVHEFDTTSMVEADIVEGIAALWRAQALMLRG
jgi:shikimate kinase